MLKGIMLKNTGKIIGYIRTSTNKQDLTNQQHEILS
jgi:DNA invertase Pin-like site-specific DNA recombinase